MNSKIRKCYLVFILALTATYSLSNAYGANVPIAGSKCAKPGLSQNYNGLKFTCIKTGKKLVWSKGVAVPTKPAPTQSAIPTPEPTIGNIELDPEINMRAYSETSGIEQGTNLAYTNRIHGYVEIKYPDFASFKPTSKYFVVIGNDGVFNHACQGTPNDLLEIRQPVRKDSLFWQLLPISAKGTSIGKFLKVEGFPITFKCEYKSEAKYTIYVAEIDASEKFVIAKSPTVEFFTPKLHTL